ncbi:MAG: hypothetical protein IT305_07325 [Chloroflexi bacterium]|nr:hypothetical protein [Chloroflexota bacterium]
MDNESAENKAALWTFVGMILAFKLATSIVIFIMAPGAWSFVFLLVMQWYWLLLPCALVGAPTLFWFRLWRVRRRRQKLILSEWQVKSRADWNPISPRGKM